MTVVLVVAAVWVGVLVLLWALLAMAKRADEDAAHIAGRDIPAVEALPGQVALGRLAADVQRTLGVERVAVIVGDSEEGRHAGRVAACAGAPAVLGARVALDEPAAVLAPGLEDPWPIACAPLARAGETIGVVAVVGRDRPFTAHDHELLERLATAEPRRFDRVRRPVRRRSPA